MGGHDVEMSELFQTLGNVSGVRAPRFRVPRWLAIAMAETLERWSRITGQRSLMPLEG